MSARFYTSVNTRKRDGIAKTFEQGRFGSIMAALVDICDVILKDTTCTGLKKYIRAHNDSIFFECNIAFFVVRLEHTRTPLFIDITNETRANPTHSRYTREVSNY